MSAKEQLADYMRGWVTAVKFGPISDGDNINGHFNQGWRDGRAAKDAAYRAACAHYDLKPEYVHAHTQPK